MRWNDDRMEDAKKGAPSIRSYGIATREAVDQLSRTVFGKLGMSANRPPGAYRGKKFMIFLFCNILLSYLFSL